MHKPRILFLCGGTVLYGAERMALTMMECALQNGWDVECVSSAWTDGRFAREVKAIGVRCTLIYLGWLYASRLDWSLASLFHWPGAAFRFWSAVRRFRPDLIVAFGYRPIFQLWPFLRVPVVVSIHETADSTALRLGLLPLAAKKAARFWACSGFICENLVSAGVPPAKIVAMTNAVPVFPPDSPPRNRPSPRVRFGIVGRISSQKGQGLLLRAAALLASEQRSQCEFVLVGDGPGEEVSRLRSDARSLGVADLFTFAGYIDDRNAVFDQLDVLVLPVTAPEAFGLVAVEAGLHSIPVIASRLGGLPEIVRDGVGGLLIPPDDPFALCGAIREMLNNPERRAEMGRAHSQFCRQGFSSRRLASDLAAEVQSLLASNQAGNRPTQ